MSGTKSNLSSFSKVYHNINSLSPREYWDYHSHSITWRKIRHYEVGKKIGQGKFSEVFDGTHKKTQKKVIIKKLKPITSSRVRREVLILTHLKGHENITNIFDTVKDEDNETRCIITRYNKSEDHRKVFPQLTENDVKIYIFYLLSGLNYAHSKGIIHRDIKPRNIAIDHDRRKLKIIDWGMAEFYHPHKEYNLSVASLHYKAPELLLGIRQYDYSMDIWSTGCVFAGIIFMNTPFLKGKNNIDQLNKISRIAGSRNLDEYIRKYKAPPLEIEKKEAIGHYQKQNLLNLINIKNKHLASESAIDLLSSLLTIDHQKRLTAKEAMAHPYFSDIRGQPI